MWVRAHDMDIYVAHFQFRIRTTSGLSRVAVCAGAGWCGVVVVVGWVLRCTAIVNNHIIEWVCISMEFETRITTHGVSQIDELRVIEYVRMCLVLLLLPLLPLLLPNTLSSSRQKYHLEIIRLISRTGSHRKHIENRYANTYIVRVLIKTIQFASSFASVFWFRIDVLWVWRDLVNFSSHNAIHQPRSQTYTTSPQ